MFSHSKHIFFIATYHSDAGAWAEQKKSEKIVGMEFKVGVGNK